MSERRPLNEKEIALLNDINERGNLTHYESENRYGVDGFRVNRAAAAYLVRHGYVSASNVRLLKSGEYRINAKGKKALADYERRKQEGGAK